MVALLIAASSLASTNSFHPFNCQPTQRLKPVHTLDVPIVRSNNLRRPTGSPDIAEGLIINIMGIIKDRNCLPVRDAIITLWQTDPDGNFGEYFVKKEAKIKHIHPYPNFSYNGLTSTNNRGEFYFFTLFPGAYSNKAPALNIRVSHSRLGDLETQVFFNHHPRNDLDFQYKQLDDTAKKSITAIGSSVNEKNPLSDRLYRIELIYDALLPYKVY